MSLVLCHEHEIKRATARVDLHFSNRLSSTKNHFGVKYTDAYNTKEHAVNCIILSRHIITSYVPICTYVYIHTYIYMHESTIANNGNAENDVKWTEAWFCICTMYMYDHCPIIILLRCSISVWTNSTPIDKCMSSICIYTQMIDVYVRFIQRARIRSRIIEFVWILSIVKNRSVVAWLIFYTSKRLKWVWDVQFPLSSLLFCFMYACLVRVICDTLNIFSYVHSINTWVE